MNDASSVDLHPRASVTAAAPATGTHAANPVIAGFHPDPSICEVDGVFYLVTSSFEYFPGIPIFESRDLVSWSQIGHCLTRDSQLDLAEVDPSHGIYAPTIRFHDGIFFVTSTNVSRGGHFIVHASDPRGPWSDPVWVDQSGIDPSLFFHDGLVYFQSNVEPDPAGEHKREPDFVRGIQQCTVDPFTGKKTSPSRFIWAGSGGMFPEAPHMFRRGDHFYLLAAEGGTERGHMVTIARAISVWGPFEGYHRNPILSHRSTSSAIQSTGHADFVELADGSWWAVFLGTRPIGNWHHLGRETFLAPVTWHSDDWPEIGDRGAAVLRITRPDLPRHDHPAVPPRIDFDGPALDLSWNTLRTPPTETMSLVERPGWLVQHGTHATSSDRNSVFVGRRQQHFDFVASAHLDRDGLNGGEGGLIVRIDEHHHYELAVAGEPGAQVLLHRQRIGDLVVETSTPCPSGDIILRVEATATDYTFSATDSGGTTVGYWVSKARYLSSEVAGGFTGVYIGLYVVGEGATAAWDWFEYSGATVAVTV